MQTIIDGTPQGNIILYQTEDGQNRIDVTLSGDTVWLTADQMAELFQRNKSTISRHIRGGWTFREIKSLQQVGLYIFAKIITDMVKKMLFLWVKKCGQEWPERPHATV